MSDELIQSLERLSELASTAAAALRGTGLAPAATAGITAAVLSRLEDEMDAAARLMRTGHLTWETSYEQ